MLAGEKECSQARMDLETECDTAIDSGHKIISVISQELPTILEQNAANLSLEDKKLVVELQQLERLVKKDIADVKKIKAKLPQQPTTDNVNPCLIRVWETQHSDNAGKIYKPEEIEATLADYIRDAQDRHLYSKVPILGVEHKAKSMMSESPVNTSDGHTRKEF